jgi:hypothetical protein
LDLFANTNFLGGSPLAMLFWLATSVNPGGSPLFPAVIEGILWG